MSDKNNVMASAHERCENVLKGLRAAFPEAGLSFGYIGNLTSQMDDRSWRFFSHIPKKDAHGFETGESWSFGGYSTEDLDHCAAWAEAELGKRIRRALDPAFDAKCRINDWFRASDATKEQHPGAIFQKQFGGVDGFAVRTGIVVMRDRETFVGKIDDRVMPAVANHRAAMDQLDDYYDALPDYVKRSPVKDDPAPDHLSGMEP
jgi:hypothetical protein